jgi:flagellar export protein FliJ
MAFRYPFQSLLRLRESLERQEEQRLLAIAAVVARLRAQIEKHRQGELAAKRVVLEEMEKGSSGAALQFAGFCGTASHFVRKGLELQLEEEERKRLVQLREYQAARRKREVLQSLRERRETAYELEFARHEQQAADEAFLMRPRVDSDE